MGSLRPNSPLNGGRGHSPGVSSPRGNNRGSPSPPPTSNKTPPASHLDPQQQHTNNKSPNGNLSTTPTKRKNSVKSETLGGQGNNGISNISKKKNL